MTVGRASPSRRPMKTLSRLSPSNSWGIGAFLAHDISLASSASFATVFMLRAVPALGSPGFAASTGPCPFAVSDIDLARAERHPFVGDIFRGRDAASSAGASSKKIATTRLPGSSANGLAATTAAISSALRSMTPHRLAHMRAERIFELTLHAASGFVADEQQVAAGDEGSRAIRGRALRRSP